MYRYLFFGLMVIATGATGCRQAQQQPDLDTPVKYIIDGHKLQIPLRYHYYESIKRKGRWPRPKPDFKDSQYLEIVALLPDLVPYRDDNAHEFEKLGHGNRIAISLRKNSLRPLKDILTDIQYRLTLRPDAPSGLIRYAERQPPGQATDLYIKKDDANGFFKMRCVHDKALPSPACKVTRIDKRGLVLEYTFKLEALEQWETIGASVNALIEGFEVK